MKCRAHTLPHQPSFAANSAAPKTPGRFWMHAARAGQNATPHSTSCRSASPCTQRDADGLIPKGQGAAKLSPPAGQLTRTPPWQTCRGAPQTASSGQPRSGRGGGPPGQQTRRWPPRLRQHGSAAPGSSGSCRQCQAGWSGCMSACEKRASLTQRTQRGSPSNLGTSSGSPTTTSSFTGKGRKPQGSSRPVPKYSGRVKPV